MENIAKNFNNIQVFPCSRNISVPVTVIIHFSGLYPGTKEFDSEKNAAKTDPKLILSQICRSCIKCKDNDMKIPAQKVTPFSSKCMPFFLTLTVADCF